MSFVGIFDVNTLKMKGGKAQDFSNMVFGRLTVVKRVIGHRHGVFWECKCNCGNTKIVDSRHLKHGNTTSCGCYAKESSSKINRVHGMSKTIEWKRWKGMISRCKYEPSEKNKVYKNINVCERWLSSFENFYKDMGPLPCKQYTLERLRSTEDYGPDNCIWAKWDVQTRNVSRNKWIEHKGIKMIQQDWANLFGVTHSAVILLLRKYSFEDIYEWYINKVPLPAVKKAYNGGKPRKQRRPEDELRRDEKGRVMRPLNEIVI